MATVNTINDLPALGRTPTSGDKLALQPQGDNTKSIDYDALATAIINKLGGDPVTVEHGGFGGTTVAQARTNLSVYSKAETDSAIAQSTATLNLHFSANDNTWDRIYNIVSSMSNNASAFFVANGAAANVLTGGKQSAVIKGLISCANATSGVYDFMAFTGYQSQYIWIWRISALSSASATPTVGTVYRFTGTAL